MQRLNSFNRLFQREKPLLHILRPVVSALVREITSDFLDLEYVKSKQAQEIEPESHQLPLEDVYVRMATTNTLSETEIRGARSSDLQTYRYDCRNFMIEIIHQIQKRFDMKGGYQDMSAEKLAHSDFKKLECGKKLTRSFRTKIVSVSQLDREWREHVLKDIALKKDTTLEEIAIKLSGQSAESLVIEQHLAALCSAMVASATDTDLIRLKKKLIKIL
eukprot:gene11408-12597_t